METQARVEEREEEEPRVEEPRDKISDKHLRTVSLSCRHLLLESRLTKAGSPEFMLNPDLVDFLRTVKDKYRIYLLTQLDGEDEQS